MRFSVTTDEFHTPCVVDRTTGRGVFYDPSLFVVEHHASALNGHHAPRVNAA